MNHEWVFLSILAAFGQALNWALKKKTLENKGLNNTLGCVSYLSAGVLLGLVFGIVNDWTLPTLTSRFWEATGIIIVSNVIASWAAFKALDRAPMSLLMPFFSVSALFIVPIEFVVRGSGPNVMQILGIIVLVAGAILLSAKAMPDKKARQAVGAFVFAVLFYSIAATFMGVAVNETRSGLFSGAVFQLGIAIGFIPLVLMAKELRTVSRLRQSGEWKKVLRLMIVAGVVFAFLENGPGMVALLSAKASEVVALKRTMPFFAFVLGVFMFREHISKRHVLGTTLLVAGSFCVVWFR